MPAECQTPLRSSRRVRRYFSYFKESIRSGTIAALVMMPFGFLFKFLDLRVGYYGPKFVANEITLG